MERFKNPEAVGPTTCLAYGPGGAINNYSYPSPEDIPTEPQACPRLVNGATCGALVVMQAIEVEGLRHVANAQMAEGQKCPNAPRMNEDILSLMAMVKQMYL